MSRVIVFGAFLLLSRVSNACTVCFGGGGGDMARGFFWGIVLMLVLLFSLMAFLIGYVVYATKRHSKQLSTQLLTEN